MDPQQMATALRGESQAINAAFSRAVPDLQRISGVPRMIQFIRHGATALNNDDVSVDRMRGWTDVPLSKDGMAEAEKLGQKLTQDPPNHIISSDLKRAHETARIISEHTNAPVTATMAFRPWNVGNLAGRSSKEGIPILAKYAAQAPHEPVPGGESFNNFRSRFFNGLHDTLSRYGGNPAIVAHHRNERLLHAWIKAGYPPDGSIDMDEFNKKGEHTGAEMKLLLPMDKVAAVASHPIGQSLLQKGAA